MSYRPAATLISLFQDLVTAGKATQETVGQTVDGNTIYAFHFGNPSGGHVMWEAVIHGDEIVNGEIMYQYALWLTAGSNEANRILNGNYTTIIPIVNRDDYSVTRKNAHGVDLNRNFIAGYNVSVAGGCDPTASGCCSQKLASTVPACYNYEGTTALSEPESHAIHNYVNNKKPAWFIDMHAFDTTGPIYYDNDSHTLGIINAYLTAVTSSGYRAYNVGSSYAGGYAFQDANSLGCKSILWEFGRYSATTNPPFADVLPTWFPLFLPMAKLISADVEVTPHPDGVSSAIPLVIIAGIVILLSTL